MEIVVLVKNALDPSRIKVKDDAVLLDKSPRITSSIDKNALEAALQLRDICGGKIRALTIGGSSAKDSLVEALAMGVDEAVFVNSGKRSLNGLEKAKALSNAIRKISPSVDLVLLGEASIDNFSSQTGPRLSVELDLPYVSYVANLKCEEKNGTYIFKLTKNIGEYTIEMEAPTPLILSVTREINRPRYVPFSRILRASRQASKLIKEINLDTILIDHAGSLKRTKAIPYKVSRKRIVFEDPPEISVKKLIKVLEEEGVLS